MKNFKNWNNKKIKLENKNGPNPKVRDIWWSYVGVNLGDEQDGGNKSFQRPVLILKKFNNRIFLALPLTSKEKNNKFHHKLQTAKVASNIILSQIRLMSTKRLRRKIERIEQEEFLEILEKVINLIK